MAEQLLMRILTMSLTASAVILAVLLLRLCLKKAPRFFRTACGLRYCSACSAPFLLRLPFLLFLC